MSKKTTEEIVKGLELCADVTTSCDGCPYHDITECGINLKKDAHDALVDLLANRPDGIKTTVEEKSESEDTEVKFKSSFDLESMKNNTKKYMEHLGNEGRKQMDKNHIATLAVSANVDALKGNDTTKAFIGGVSVSFKGTAHQRTEILYQLIRTCYNLLKDEGTERTANAIMDQVFEQVKSGKDHFDFDPDEAMKHSLMELMDRLRSIAESNDDDEDTSD